jgi:DNA repair protein RadC
MPGDNRKGATRKEDSMNDDQIVQKAREILAARMCKGAVIGSPSDSVDFLVLQLAEHESEAFCVIYLNSQNQVIEFAEEFRGTIDGAAVYPREIVKAALSKNAAAVIFAHNHPSGVAEPSAADQRITDRLIAALGLIDVRVLDHIIVAGNNTFSFREHGLL